MHSVKSVCNLGLYLAKNHIAKVVSSFSYQFCCLVTGSIAHSAKCWYISYSEGDFENCLPRTGDTLLRCRWNLARRSGLNVHSSLSNFTASVQW